MAVEILIGHAGDTEILLTGWGVLLALFIGWAAK